MQPGRGRWAWATAPTVRRLAKLQKPNFSLMNCIGPPLSETPRVPRFLRQRLALQLLCRTGPAHRRSPSFTTPARSIPSGHQSRAMATFGLITCVSPSSAHTHPKLDSYQESYQAWRHAPGQPALKGFSYSHAYIYNNNCMACVEATSDNSWKLSVTLAYKCTV